MIAFERPGRGEYLSSLNGRAGGGVRAVLRFSLAGFAAMVLVAALAAGATVAGAGAGDAEAGQTVGRPAGSGGWSSAEVASATSSSSRATGDQPDTLPDGRFAPGKLRMRTEAVAVVPQGARYMAVSPDLSRMACYVVKDSRVIPFICGKDGAPGGPADLLKRLAEARRLQRERMRPTTRPTTGPRTRPTSRPYRSGATTRSGYTRYRATTRPSVYRRPSRPTTRPAPVYRPTTRPSSSSRRYGPASRPASRPASDMPHTSSAEIALCVFSADSKSHLFAVGQDSNLGKLWRLGRSLSNARVIWKGVSGRSYAEINGLGISPDGAHYSFLARDYKRGWLVVIDGREAPLAGLTGTPVTKPGTNSESPRCPDMCFSPDRTKFIRFAGERSYGLSTGPIYLNEKRIDSAPVVSDAIWSRNSKRYAYVISETKAGHPRTTTAYRVVVDGKKSAAYKSVMVRSMVFSNDGKQFAFIASGDAVSARGLDRALPAGDQFVVRNGVEGKHYRWIGSAYSFEGSRGSYGMGWPGLDFTPGGDVVYMISKAGPPDARGRRTNKYVVMSGQRESPGSLQYKWVAFSADRKHSVYIGRPGCTTAKGQPAGGSSGRIYRSRSRGSFVFVHDGREGRALTGTLSNPVISPDGRHAAAWLVPATRSASDMNTRIVVDDTELRTIFRYDVKADLKYVSPTVIRMRTGSGQTTCLYALRLKTPHPRATDARSRGIKFPISFPISK